MKTTNFFYLIKIYILFYSLRIFDANNIDDIKNWLGCNYKIINTIKIERVKCNEKILNFEENYNNWSQKNINYNNRRRGNQNVFVHHKYFHAYKFTYNLRIHLLEYNKNMFLINLPQNVGNIIFIRNNCVNFCIMPTLTFVIYKLL